MRTELAQVARRIGRLLAQWRAERKFAGKQQGSQFKAEVDQLAHELWTKELQALAPGTRILSEEDSRSHEANVTGNYWIIDPLDGTASFVGGFSGWVTQAAWMENHRPVAAVVFAPLTDEIWQAETGKGAFRNGVRLRLDPVAPMVSLVDNYPEPRGIAAAAMRQFGLSRYLESGSIGLKICRVATGEADVFVKDVPVRSWDVAPGDLILSEAGGVLTALGGEPFDYRFKLEHEGAIGVRSAPLCFALSKWAAAWCAAGEPCTDFLSAATRLTSFPQ